VPTTTTACVCRWRLLRGLDDAGSTAHPACRERTPSLGEGMEDGVGKRPGKEGASAAWLHTDWIGAAVEKRQAVSAGCAPGSRRRRPWARCLELVGDGRR
jgi:hypothetical protein